MMGGFKQSRSIKYSFDYKGLRYEGSAGLPNFKVKRGDKFNCRVGKLFYVENQIDFESRVKD